MTAKELAREAKISASYLSEVERGISAVSSEKLLKIARHLGVSLEYLLEGEAGTPLTNQRPDVHIPAALSEAADQLDLTFNETMRLIQARQSLRARRSTGQEHEFDSDGWVRFYKRVKDFMEE